PSLAAAALTVATTGFYAPLGRFWEWNVTNSPGFVFAGTNLWSALGKGLTSVGGFVMFHPVLVVAAGACVVAAVRTVRRRRLPDEIDLWLWVATGVAAWGAGLRFFGHYWLQVVPPLVLLAVPVVATWARSRARPLLVAAVAVPAVVAWALLFVAGSFHHRPNPAPLASYVRAHTSTTDRVFVWGSYPEVLLAADRLPAGGLVHTDFVVGRSGGRNDPAATLSSAVPGAVDIMLRSLAADPPALILDTSTSASLGYEKYPTSLIPALDRFIRDHYDRATSVDGVQVLKRRA
ncbi:MAG TPA: hypothetical protein VGC84_01545, partial [Ilumatobacteraceae bacterium]